MRTRLLIKLLGPFDLGGDDLGQSYNVNGTRRSSRASSAKFHEGAKNLRCRRTLG
jgi:hypothetical protein